MAPASPVGNCPLFPRSSNGLPSRPIVESDNIQSFSLQLCQGQRPLDHELDILVDSTDLSDLNEANLITRLDAAHAFIRKLAPCWFLTPPNNPDDLSSMVAELVLQQSKEFLRSAAEVAANGFSIPLELLRTEADLLLASGSFEAFVEGKKAAVLSSRFNEARCREYFSDDPEFATLLELATNGATIDVDPDFVPNTRPEPFRVSHDTLQHTYEIHAFKFWQKSQGILLPTDVALNLGLHFSPVHWTPKPFTPLGRFLLDLSNSTSGPVLNQPSAKILVDARFGVVSYPSIHEVIETLFAAADEYGWDNVVMWKDDIVGAFNQFMFSAKSSKLLALRISPHATLIMFTGVFGWLGSPAVWAVFSRALLRLLCRIILFILLYCDDFMAFGHVDRAHFDQLKLHTILRGIFGPDVINPTKSIGPSRSGDLIGWTIHIDTRSIYPNDKGCKKLAAVFFSCNANDIVTVKALQRMGSLASRYSRGVVGSRPFVHAFFEGVSKGKNHHVSREIKLAIYVWRAIAVLLLQSPTSLAVPLSFIRLIKPFVEFPFTSDAGPEGLGVKVFNSAGSLVGFVSYRLPFDARDPAYQNMREFLGCILGLLLVHHFQPNATVVHWTNDNKAALSWVQNDLAKSKSAQAAFLIFTWCKIMARIEVAHTSHIAGITMGEVDSLSRFLPTPLLPVHLDLASIIPTTALDDLFLLCSPVAKNQTLLLPWESTLNKVMSLLDACLSAW